MFISDPTFSDTFSYLRMHTVNLYSITPNTSSLHHTAASSSTQLNTYRTSDHQLKHHVKIQHSPLPLCRRPRNRGCSRAQQAPPTSTPFESNVRAVQGFLGQRGRAEALGRGRWFPKDWQCSPQCKYCPRRKIRKIISKI